MIFTANVARDSQRRATSAPRRLPTESCRKSAALLTKLASGTRTTHTGTPGPASHNARSVGVAVFIVVALFQASLSAQSFDTSHEGGGIDAELHTLFDNLPLVAPEIAADVVLRLLESPITRDAAFRLNALELTDSLIAAVPEPTRRKLTVGDDLDTASGSKHLAMLMALDRVSLSLRVVRVLLRWNPQGARERFASIDLALRPTPCTSGLVPDVADYYQVLHDVFSRGFDRVERAAGEDMLFLESHLRLVSAAQIKPVADLLVALQIPSPQWERLVFGFAQDLQSLTTEDRDFSDNTMADAAAILNLGRIAEDRGVSAVYLLRALRGYLIRHAAATRCADSAERSTALSKTTLPVVNAALTVTSAGIQVPPITERDIESPRLVQGVDEPKYWRSDSAQSLRREAMELRFPNQREVTNRQSNSWRRQFYEFVNDLRVWAGTDEASPNDYWNQKAILFESLLSISMTDRDRAVLVREWCGLMDEWYVNTTAVGEWLYRLRRGLDSTMNSQFSAGADEHCVVLANPAVSLYRQVEALTRQCWRAMRLPRRGGGEIG